MKLFKVFLIGCCMLVLFAEPGLVVIINFSVFSRGNWWTSSYLMTHLLWLIVHPKKAVEHYSSWYHIFGWATPAVLLIVTMLSKSVSADGLSGLCRVEYGSSLWIIPHLVLHASGFILFFVGFISMCRIQFDLEDAEEQTRVKLLMRRQWFFHLTCLWKCVGSTSGQHWWAEVATGSIKCNVVLKNQ